MHKMAPEYIIKYYCEEKRDPVFTLLKKQSGSEDTFVYKIKCICGAEKFFVYEGKHPSVSVECAECGERIVVYDLSYYPAAIDSRLIIS